MSDQYILGDSNRNLSTLRLNLQYYLIKASLKGNLLDPNIPFEEPNLRIADVCSGTGIWLVELAECVPSTTRLDGLDQNISQTPPKEWLPTNVTFKRFNIFDDIPEELVEVYDVIHIQLTLTFVRDDKIQAVLQNILTMLKPGGHIQWVEFDYHHVKYLSSDANTKPKEIEAAIDGAWEMVNMGPPKWTATLPSIFAETPHLTLVGTETANVRYPLLRATSEMHLWGVEDLCATMLQRFPHFQERVEKLRELVKTAENRVADAMEGVWVPVVSVVGRKEGS